MKKIPANKRFIEHLERASRIVKSWPQWKKDVYNIGPKPKCGETVEKEMRR